MELTRLSQRNTNLRLLFNIYKTRKNPSQPIIDKFKAISGILCVLCIFVVPYVKIFLMVTLRACLSTDKPYIGLL